ncbi:MAG: thioredoxin family protein [Cephaloticoccus sp.]|nr:thioredoxin family protein [Cephaloticoccus sp.]
MRNLGLALAILSATPIFAVQLGDTREAVIAELGKPQSQMAAGPREFLNYPDGRVEIRDGRVIEFRGVLAKPAAAAPLDQTAGTPPVQQSASTIQAAPLATVAPTPQRVPRQRTAHWFTDIVQAQAAAQKENKLILALFTGTDWCGPCQQFKAEVELDQQFADIFSGSFVFFKNDWLRNTPQPKVVQEEVGRVKRKYRISAYPTLKVLNAEGEVLDTVEWTKVQGGSFKEIMIEAIDNSRKATKGGKKVASGWWPF